MKPFKVPLMIKMPRVNQGHVINTTPVIGMDIPATIYDLTNTKVDILDGQRLVPCKPLFVLALLLA